MYLPLKFKLMVIMLAFFLFQNIDMALVIDP